MCKNKKNNRPKVTLVTLRTTHVTISVDGQHVCSTSFSTLDVSDNFLSAQVLLFEERSRPVARVLLTTMTMNVEWKRCLCQGHAIVTALDRCLWAVTLSLVSVAVNLASEGNDAIDVSTTFGVSAEYRREPVLPAAYVSSTHHHYNRSS